MGAQYHTIPRRRRRRREQDGLRRLDIAIDSFGLLP